MALEVLLKQQDQNQATQIDRIKKRDAPKQPTMKKYKPDNAIPLVRKENATEALQEHVGGVCEERYKSLLSELTQKQEEFLNWLKPYKSKTEIKEYWKSGKASRKSVFLWLKKLIENGFVEENENSYTVFENLKNKFIGLPEPNIIYPITQLHKPTQSLDNSCFKQCKTPITPDYPITPEGTKVCNCVNGCKTTFTQHKANNINTLSDAVTLCNEKNNTEHKPEGTYLDRSCVICGSDDWLILKPDSAISAIKCLNCDHIELHVNQRPKKKYSSN